MHSWVRPSKRGRAHRIHDLLCHISGLLEVWHGHLHLLEDTHRLVALVVTKLGVTGSHNHLSREAAREIPISVGSLLAHQPRVSIPRNIDGWERTLDGSGEALGEVSHKASIELNVHAWRRGWHGDSGEDSLSLSESG